MARFLSYAAASWTATVVSILTLFNVIIPTVRADSDAVYIKGTDANGVTRTLLDSRSPALYTGNFGDCMGGQSLLNVTSFDAAYYADNMTVLFHLAGSTNLKNESVMRTYIGLLPAIRLADPVISIHLSRGLRRRPFRSDVQSLYRKH